MSSLAPGQVPAPVVAVPSEPSLPTPFVDLEKAKSVPQVVVRSRSKDAASVHSSPPDTVHENPDDFPDGGLEAWLVVLGMWCTMFTTFGPVNAMGVFQDYYVREGLKDYPVSTSSWILSVMTCVLCVTGIIFGYLTDRFGPRPLLIGGTITCTAGLVALSFSREYYQFFLSQSILWAAGAGCVCFSAMSAPSTYFLRRRAIAIGITMTGPSVAGIILPYMMRPLIANVGFGWAVRAMALLFLLMQVLAIFVVKYRVRGEPARAAWRDYVTSLHDAPIVWTITGFFFFWLGMLLPYNYGILQANDLGMSDALASAMLPVLNAMSGVGRIIPSLAADKLGQFNTTIALSVLGAVACFAVWIPGGRSVPAIVVFMALFGFSSGAVSSLEPVAIAQISELEQLGTRTGAAFTVGGFGALVGAPIAGSIIAAQGGSYVGLQVFCGLCMAASAACFWVARAMQRDLRAKTWKV